jgi:hypothetical protein
MAKVDTLINTARRLSQARFLAEVGPCPGLYDSFDHYLRAVARAGLDLKRWLDTQDQRDQTVRLYRDEDTVVMTTVKGIPVYGLGQE